MMTLILLDMRHLNETCHAITSYSLNDPDLHVVDCVSPRTWISPPPTIVKTPKMRVQPAHL